MPFKKLGQLLRDLRENNGLLLREVAAKLQIDPSMLSKIELGDKKPTKEHVLQLARIYHFDEKQLLINFLSEKVIYELDGEELAIEALKAAEEKIKYHKNQNQ